MLTNSVNKLNTISLDDSNLKTQSESTENKLKDPLEDIASPPHRLLKHGCDVAKEFPMAFKIYKSGRLCYFDLIYNEIGTV